MSSTNTDGSSVCPTRVWSVEGPAKTFAWVLTISFPLIMLLCLATFFYYKDTSVFLRKRPVDLLLVSVIGSFGVWGVTALYDAIGSELFPCWLYVLLAYLATPLIACPVLLKAMRYINLVSQARLLSGEKLAFGNDEEKHLSVMETTTMWESFKCYWKLFVGNRDRVNRIKSSRFTGSKLFIYAWFAYAILPYLIVYLIRMFTSDVWRSGCYGCELELSDSAFLLSFYILGSGLFLMQVPPTSNARDALRIKRETVFAWTGAGFWINIAMLLFIIDPNSAYANSKFNYRILAALGAIHAVYFQTIHQVVVAKGLQRQLLVSPNFNRGDLFQDVMQDKELAQRLTNFLHSELSSEILLFMDAVDTFRKDFEIKKDSRQRAARQIFDEFISRRAVNEVNLSHDVRELVYTRITPGNVNVHVFDEAYNEIKSMLLKDGFIRFLNSIRGELTKGNQTTGHVAPFTGIEATASHTSNQVVHSAV